MDALPKTTVLARAGIGTGAIGFIELLDLNRI
jgi:hypothetical protein